MLSMSEHILSRRINLIDGRELRTTRDAIQLIENGPHSIIADDALALLRRAAETGRREDIRAATNALMRTLRHLAILGAFDERRR